MRLKAETSAMTAFQSGMNNWFIMTFGWTHSKSYVLQVVVMWPSEFLFLIPIFLSIENVLKGIQWVVMQSVITTKDKILEL